MSKKTAAQVFSDTKERLLNFIRRRVDSFEDAQDILLEVFFNFMQADDEVNPIDNAAAWLYRAASNKIIDRQRKKKEVSFPVYYSEDDEYIFEEIADFIYGEEATPETEMLRAVILEEIQAAIAELPKEQREVFELTELLDFSVKEVSQETKTPINTVLSRKHYAIKFLRKRLEELYNDVMDF
ncbi:MAG: sigma-70 family RNA polymerase sigma factor [Chitinispirillales bacterium]|nr:sigma-70 family RNA polymerase sigma factor [Chitinispirillales bacterium]